MKKKLSSDESESVIGGTEETRNNPLPYVEMTTKVLICWDCHSKTGAFAKDRSGTPCPCCGSIRTVVLNK